MAQHYAFRFFSVVLCVCAGAYIVGGCARDSVQGSSAYLQWGSGTTSYPFATISINNSTQQTIQLTNSGQTSAKLTGASLALAGNFSFVGGTYPGTAGTCSARLPAGTTCTIVTNFTTSTGGNYSSDYALTYDDGAQTTTLPLTLSGTAVPQGILDTTFNKVGYAVYDFGFDERVSKVMVRSDQKIFAGGDENSGTSSNRNFGLLRISSDGTLDSAFGTFGRVTTAVGGALASSYCNTGVTWTSTDTTVLMGQAGNYSASAYYQSSGTLSTSFGIGGIAVLNSVLGVLNTDAINAAVSIPTGQYYIAGQSTGALGNQEFVAKMASTGSLDLTAPLFGVAGLVSNLLGGTAADVLSGIAVQLDGKVVAGGYAQNTLAIKKPAILRLTTTGGLDTTFNGTGKLISDICGYATNSEILAISSINGNKTIVTGYCIAPTADRDVFVARYNFDGTLDTTFNSPTGKLIIDLSTSHKDDSFSSMAIQSDDKIVLAGYTNNGSQDRWTLVRLTSTGVLDTGFGTNGIVTTTVGTNDRINSIAIQPLDGKIVVGGYATVGGIKKYAVGRYFP